MRRAGVTHSGTWLLELSRMGVDAASVGRTTTKDMAASVAVRQVRVSDQDLVCIHAPLEGLGGPQSDSAPGAAICLSGVGIFRFRWVGLAYPSGHSLKA